MDGVKPVVVQFEARFVSGHGLAAVPKASHQEMP
jgi:hypothetical protein